VAADQEGMAEAWGKGGKVGMGRVEPGGGHGATELLEAEPPAAGRLGDGEDDLRVHGQPRIGMGESVAGHQLVVVEDRSVVNADDRAVADGMVVGSNLRMSLRVVAHVEEDLPNVGRD